MILKILAVICVVKYCTAEPPLKPEQPKKHARSSQSFIRHDVPLSYQYSAVHDYTTMKSLDNEPATPLTHEGVSYNHEPKTIQYAPVVRDEEVQNVLRLAALHGTIQNEPITAPINTKNIEPKIKTNQGYLSRNPGYEREIFQGVKKYPGHNAIYRQYPNTPSTNNVNTNYLNEEDVHNKEQVLQPKYQYIRSTQPPTLNIYDFVPKQYITPTTESYNTEQLKNYGVIATPQHMAQAIKLQPQIYTFHPKTHRILLNLARAYNIAHLPYKFNNKTNKSYLKETPIHTQVIIARTVPKTKKQKFT
ncbi:hypothetical protein ACJJTC_008956 [Scirpophaga incertulas]